MNEQTENAKETQFGTLYLPQSTMVQLIAPRRDMAAWLRLVPREHSTGGKQCLLGTSKRGNKYLRTLLIHAARAALPHLAERPDTLGRWLQGLLARVHRNKVAVALANKLARFAWAVLAGDRPYQAQSHA